MTNQQAAQLLTALHDSTDEGSVEMRDALRFAVLALNGRSPKDEALLCQTAGAIAGGMSGDTDISEDTIIKVSVRLARGILEEVRRG